MKNRLFYISVFSVMMLCLAASFSACGNKTSSAQADEQVATDSKFANLDAVADFMTQDLTDNSTPEMLEVNYKSLTDAITSYWTLNHKGEDQSQMTEVVFNELKAKADKLGEGSTLEMMESGSISSAMSRYFTAKEYCEKYKDNPLYQAEMGDWLKLEQKLNDFYGGVIQLANWDGSIVKVLAAAKQAAVAECRQQDYSQLHKDGKFAECGMSTSAARTNLIEEMNDAKSLDEGADVSNPEEYKRVYNEMCQSADEIVKLMDQWLASRAKLCEAEGIPENHTAALIEQLSQLLMECIEG